MARFQRVNGGHDEEMQGTTVTADYGASAAKLNRTVSWMLQDGQGSTRQLLNSSQTVVASYISDAFGNSVGGSGSSTNPFIWNGGSGYYSDTESGLQKVGARFYDPAVGRWISQDTEIVAGSAADSQAVNRYEYCRGCPIARSDGGGRLDAQIGDTAVHTSFSKGTIGSVTYLVWTIIADQLVGSFVTEDSITVVRKITTTQIIVSWDSNLGTGIMGTGVAISTTVSVRYEQHTDNLNPVAA